jgi:hypothetical protein
MEEKSMTDNRMCIFSDDRLYRYTLTIRWADIGPMVQFIGLNPSTADEQNDDPTIRRCKAFAKSFGCSAMVMTNLFAWRDTDPQGLKRTPNPIAEPGPYGAFENKNDYYLFVTGGLCSIKIACWGTKGSWFYRAAKVKQFMDGLQCLRRTKAGHPEHPLYLPSDCVPFPFQQTDNRKASV